MEAHPQPNLPESGDSSPHCREIDGDNDETPQQAAARVKLLCSYGGRIQPRPHDNQLAYFGGETKILAVERSVRFPAIAAKLAALHGTAYADLMRVKYQLPGEDLDSLISVTNDEDLEHMMIENDRLRMCSGKPAARLRLFLFTASRSIGVDVAVTAQDKKKKGEGNQSLPTPPPTVVPDLLSGNVPFPASFQAKDLTPENLVLEPSPRSDQEEEEKQQIAGETVVSPLAEVQRRILGLQIAEKHYDLQPIMHPHGTDEPLARVYYRENFRSEVHDHDLPPPAPADTLSPTPIPTAQLPSGYWAADQRGFFGPRFTSAAAGGQSPVYLIPTALMYPSTARHAYYHSGHRPLPAFPRVPPADYRDFPAMYSMAPSPQQTAAWLVRSTQRRSLRHRPA